jgi:hypothetical protein
VEVGSWRTGELMRVCDREEHWPGMNLGGSLYIYAVQSSNQKILLY